LIFADNKSISASSCYVKLQIRSRKHEDINEEVKRLN